jgi:hypothetical protein
LPPRSSITALAKAASGSTTSPSAPATSTHPALTLAYRIEADGVAIVYACDHEPHSRALAAAEARSRGQDLLHATFLAGADLVIPRRAIYGRGIWAQGGLGPQHPRICGEICDSVGVKRLALSHHDPMRSDDESDLLIERDRASLGKDSILELFGAPKVWCSTLRRPP